MRKFTVAVSAIALALLTYDDALAQAGFPPPPKVSPAAGVIDMHVHSHPDVFGRNMDDIDVAQLAKARGMRGLLLKNHVAETASRAALVMKDRPGRLHQSPIVRIPAKLWGTRAIPKASR